MNRNEVNTDDVFTLAGMASYLRNHKDGMILTVPVTEDWSEFLQQLSDKLARQVGLNKDKLDKAAEVL